MFNKSRIMAGFIIILLCFSGMTDVFCEERIPPVLEGTILIKVLSYEKKLKERCGPLFYIGFLYTANSSLSKKNMTEMYSVFEEALSNKSIQGMSSELMEIPFQSVDDLREIVKWKNVDMIYLSPDIGNKIPTILDVCKELKVLTITGSKHYVEAGATVGVVTKEAKPEILINLKASYNIGADFDIQLLKLATVIN